MKQASSTKKIGDDFSNLRTAKKKRDKIKPSNKYANELAKADEKGLYQNGASFKLKSLK